MDSIATTGMAKRLKPSVEEKETGLENGTIVNVSGEETALGTSNSEQIQMEISQIMEKIDRFTQLVSELLESGKAMLKELSNEFEERLILIHKEQMEKYEEEIQELRLVDAANEETDTVLQNAKYLFQNIRLGN